MILVDTSAWIEWLIGSPTGETLAAHLPEQADWLVPTVVQLELAKWLTREVGEDKADQVIEPPRVYRRVICSTTRRPYRACSGLHRTPPLLQRA